MCCIETGKPKIFSQSLAEYNVWALAYSKAQTCFFCAALLTQARHNIGFLLRRRKQRQNVCDVNVDEGVASLHLHERATPSSTFTSHHQRYCCKALLCKGLHAKQNRVELFYFVFCCKIGKGNTSDFSVAVKNWKPTEYSWVFLFNKTKCVA